MATKIAALVALAMATGCNQQPASQGMARKASPDEIKTIATQIAEHRSTTDAGHHERETTFGDPRTAALRMHKAGELPKIRSSRKPD